MKRLTWNWLIEAAWLLIAGAQVHFQQYGYAVISFGVFLPTALRRERADETEEVNTKIMLWSFIGTLVLANRSRGLRPQPPLNLGEGSG